MSIVRFIGSYIAKTERRSSLGDLDRLFARSYKAGQKRTLLS